jgi:hypothetical protein
MNENSPKCINSRKPLNMKTRERVTAVIKENQNDKKTGQQTAARFMFLSVLDLF